MKEKQKKSKTNWKRIDSLKDNQIDYSDIPELDNAFWENAKVTMPSPKVKVTIRLDPTIVTWFKSSGSGYQTRINAILKSYISATKKKEKQHN